MNDYLYQNLVAIDQLANSLTCGKADETLSSRAYRAELEGKVFGKIFRPFFDFLLRPFGKNHCMQAYLSEINRRQLPAHFRYL